MISRIIAVIAAFFLLGGTAYAESGGRYGTDSVYGALPDDAREYLDEKRITPENGGAELSPGEIFSDILETVLENAARPLEMFAALLAVILLTSLLSGLKSNTTQPKTDPVFTLVSSLAGTVIASSFLSEAMSGIDITLSAASDFMLTYVPVLAGIIAAGGQAASASVFSAVMMVIIQLLTQIASKLLIPMCGIMLGVTAAGGLNPDLKTERLAEGIKKVIIWALGLIMTVFIGILTLQSTIASAADTVTLRAAKFAVSTSVPIVGGAVSDALATVKSSMLLLKSGMGGFGVAAVCTVLLPVLIRALCYRFFLFVSEVLADMFSADSLGKIIRCGENVLSILIAIIVCLFLFATVSTTLMLIITKG